MIFHIVDTETNEQTFLNIVNDHHVAFIVVHINVDDTPEISLIY